MTKIVICYYCEIEMNYHYDDTIPIKPVCDNCKSKVLQFKKVKKYE